MATFGYVPIASPLHDADAVRGMLDRITPALTAAGGEPASTAEAGEAVPRVLVVLTGGTERLVLDALAGRDPREAALLVAHPWHNSLPAALEALARLQQDGRPGRIVYLADGSESAAGDLAVAVADAAVAARLRTIRLGVVGTPSDWLVASMPSAEAVAAAWGPTLVSVAVDELLDAAQRQPAAASVALAGDVVRNARVLIEPDADGVDRAARLEPALRTVVDRHRLDAVTVRCFDLLGPLATSGCLALAALNDAGVIAGCEGDVPTTIGMLWTHLLLDQVPWMANPAQVDVDGDRMLLAHCTVARSLVRDYRLRSHFESGSGVGIDGDLGTGPVTLVRIGGRDLDRVWIAEGAALPHEPREQLCRTQLSVQLDPGEIARVLAAPLGNHVVVVRGHHAARLRGWLRDARPVA